MIELLNEIINGLDQVIASMESEGKKAKESETAEKTASILAEKNLIDSSSFEEVKEMLMQKNASASDLAELMRSNDESFSKVSEDSGSNNDDDTPESTFRSWYRN